MYIYRKRDIAEIVNSYSWCMFLDMFEKLDLDDTCDLSASERALFMYIEGVVHDVYADKV